MSADAIPNGGLGAVIPAAQHDSLKELAQRALPMPWDKSPTDVPFTSRHAFRDAVTPQVFLETVEALERLSTQAERLRPDGCQPTDAEKNAAAVLAKLAGSASC